MLLYFHNTLRLSILRSRLTARRRAFGCNQLVRIRFLRAKSHLHRLFEILFIETLYRVFMCISPMLPEEKKRKESTALRKAVTKLKCISWILHLLFIGWNLYHRIVAQGVKIVLSRIHSRNGPERLLSTILENYVVHGYIFMVTSLQLTVVYNHQYGGL